LAKKYTVHAVHATLVTLSLDLLDFDIVKVDRVKLLGDLVTVA
jgi:hypothetical protein